MESEVKNDSADVAEKQDLLVDFYKKYIVEEGGDVRSVDIQYKRGYSYKVKIGIVRQECKPMINSVQAL